MKQEYTTNKDLIVEYQGYALTIPAGAEVILVKDATYCTKTRKRVDGYAIKHPEKYGAYASDASTYYAYISADAVTAKLADAVLVRKATKAKSDNWQDTADKWLININGQSFDYYTGIGHRKPVGSKNSWNEPRLEPVPPKLDDVLHSLVMDSSACDESFEDWCSNYGYDTDSRKALDLYLHCQENATKLRKAGINIAAERERLQDY